MTDKKTSSRTGQPKTEQTDQNDAAMTPPEDNPQEKRGKKWWRHLVGIMATFVIVVAIFVLLPVTPNNNPKDALRGAWVALQKNDVPAFREAVDLESFIQSIMEQAVVYEETRRGQNGATAENVRQMMRSGVIGAFRHDLAETYTQQILTLVKTGELPAQTQGLMPTLWAETGAQKENFVGMRLVDQHENNALARLMFNRPDLGGKTLSLNLLLEKAPLDDHQGWALTGVPNLATFLLEIETLRDAVLAKINAPIRAELEKTITFMDVAKSAGLGNENPGVMWRIAYLNSSGEDVAGFTIKLRIYNADGQLLKTATFRETDPLPAGAAAEKAWPMPLSPADKHERHIMEQDLRTLRLETDVTEVTFASGRTLELFTKLKNAQTHGTENQQTDRGEK